jgi:hypothetical protein
MQLEIYELETLRGGDYGAREDGPLERVPVIYDNRSLLGPQNAGLTKGVFAGVPGENAPEPIARKCLPCITIA